MQYHLNFIYIKGICAEVLTVASLVRFQMSFCSFSFFLQVWFKGVKSSVLSRECSKLYVYRWACTNASVGKGVCVSWPSGPI